MAGAGVTGPKVIQLGCVGEMQCGQNSTEELCRWTDSGSQGSIAAGLNSDIGIDQLAVLTERFRSTAEH